MEFTVGDLVEAIDLVGVWSRGKVISFENGEITVGFDGYGPRHNRTIALNMAGENVRYPTTELEHSGNGRRRRIDEDIKNAMAHIRGLERDDSVWFQSENSICQGVVKTVDPMKMTVLVQLDDAQDLDLSAYYLCDAPVKQKAVKHIPCQKKKPKKTLEKPDGAAVLPEQEVPLSPYFPFVFCLRPCDGLRVQVGDVVKAQGCLAPLVIIEMWQKEGKIMVKLNRLEVPSNVFTPDFQIQCDISFLSSWDGEKVKAKSVTDALFNSASEQLLSFLKSNDSPTLRVFYRKLSLGRVLRDNISSGFSNLCSSRFSLGPFNLFTDVEIFGFDSSVARKFSLLNAGDFHFLDQLMGGKWDIKLGKDSDSFFTYVTLVEVYRTRDFVLMCNVRFSESKFLFCHDYRVLCEQSIVERKNEMATIQ